MADHKIDGNDGAGNVQAPERIWMFAETLKPYISGGGKIMMGDTEYIRADVAAAQDAAANARADKARDAALVDAMEAVGNLANEFGVAGSPTAKKVLDMAVDAVLALRDKPAPAVTPKIEVKFTWAKGDEEFWVHLKSPDGKSAGFNLGNPKGMIATALLRAIAASEA